MAKNLRGLSATLNPFPNNQRVGILGAGYTLGAYSTAIVTVASSAALVNHPELQLNLGATGYWRVSCDINLAIANAAHNIRYAFSGAEGFFPETGGVSLGRGYLSLTGVLVQEDALQFGAATVGGTTNAWTTLRICMGVHVMQPGAFVFQFGQNVSGASNTQVLGGSTMQAVYIANQLGV